MKSTDGGTTWSKRVQLNDDIDPNRRPNYDQFFPGISVAPNGRVDVAWWDFRTDALYNPNGNGNTTRRDQTCFDIYYTSSSDAGATFAKNSRISDRSMNQNEGYAMNLIADLRGPIGVASTNEEAFVTWNDSRNGTVELPDGGRLLRQGDPRRARERQRRRRLVHQGLVGAAGRGHRPGDRRPGRRRGGGATPGEERVLRARIGSRRPGRCGSSGGAPGPPRSAGGYGRRAR